MRRVRSGVRDGELGSAQLELALSLSVLIAFVLGIMAVSLAAYSYFYTCNAAREATRYAIVRGNDQASDCTAPGYANCIAQTGDIQSYAQNLAFPGIVSGNLLVTTTWLKTTGSACGTADSCKAPGNLVQSTASYGYVFTVPFFPSKTLTMTSKSQMVVAY